MKKSTFRSTKFLIATTLLTLGLASTWLLAGCSSSPSVYGPEVIEGNANSVTLNWWGALNGDRGLDAAANAYCKQYKKTGKYERALSKYRIVYSCINAQK